MPSDQTVPLDMERQASPLPTFVSLRDVLDILWAADDTELVEPEDRRVDLAAFF